jgi:hypothetical protein
MNARRAVAVALLVLAFVGLGSTRGAISLADALPTVVQIAVAVGAAACALGGVALWVKGSKVRD